MCKPLWSFQNISGLGLGAFPLWPMAGSPFSPRWKIGRGSDFWSRLGTPCAYGREREIGARASNDAVGSNVLKRLGCVSALLSSQPLPPTSTCCVL